MNIKTIEGARASDIAVAIRKKLRNSRFTALVEVCGSRRPWVKITEVRLKKKKSYCGNHPGACQLVFGKKDKILPYLEGADWVDFNDRINDVLDRLGVSAYVDTAVCVIRKGTLRRTEYLQRERGSGLGNDDWARDAPADRWEEHLGKKAPRSEFPMGTPGIYPAIKYNCVG